MTWCGRTFALARLPMIVALLLPLPACAVIPPLKRASVSLPPWRLVGPFAAEPSERSKPAPHQRTGTLDKTFSKERRSAPPRKRWVSRSPATEGPKYFLLASAAEPLVVESEPEPPSADPCPWHIDLGIRTSNTRLHETKQLLDRRLDRLLRLDQLNLFDEPYTPIDRKSDWGLTTFYLGFGRQVDDWLCWTWYAGGGSGHDEDHQQRLNLQLNVDFDYAYYFTGALFEIYPWGTPFHADNLSLGQRLYASRPYLAAGVEAGYVDAYGSGEYKLAPIRLYHDSETVRDWLFSFLVGVGWGIPLSEDWAINLSVNHAFHMYRPAEYNSWNVTSVLRYRF